MSTAPLSVLVVVGTDHHPFDRVVTTVDAWSREHVGAVDVTIQHGRAAPPTHATGVPLLGRTELDAMLASADVVVTHGGPATIADVRANGRMPIVMPRSERHGEAVDDHQVLFSRRLADRREIRLTEEVASLRQALDEAIAAPESLAIDPAADARMVQDTVERFAAVAAETTRASLRRRRRRWWGDAS